MSHGLISSSPQQTQHRGMYSRRASSSSTLSWGKEKTKGWDKLEIDSPEVNTMAGSGCGCAAGQGRRESIVATIDSSSNKRRCDLHSHSNVGTKKKRKEEKPKGLSSPLKKWLTCPICLDILFEPYTLLCGHSYCKECITEHIRASEYTPDVSRGREETKERDANCPNCRQRIVGKSELRPSVALREMLNQYFPDYIAQRGRLKALRAKKLWLEFSQVRNELIDQYKARKHVRREIAHLEKRLEGDKKWFEELDQKCRTTLERARNLKTQCELGAPKSEWESNEFVMHLNSIEKIDLAIKSIELPSPTNTAL